MTLEELRAARPDLPDDILRSALAAYDEEQTIDPAITRGNYRRQDSLGVLMGNDVATGIDGDSATAGARVASSPSKPQRRSSFLDYIDDFAPEVAPVSSAKPAKEMGDLAAGAKTALQQIPQLGYGLLAGAGAVGESLFGEGGVSSGLKKYGLEKYQAKGEEIQQYQKDIYELDTAIGKAKEGDIGALVDWAQYGLGYGVTQLATAFATGGLGAIGGKMALPTVVKSVMGGAVEKSAEAIARNQLGKAATAEAVASLAATDAVKAAAAKSVATNIGAGLAVGAQNVGMEGGEIFGDLASQATKEGRVLTGEEIARGFGATIAAAGMETAVDMLGLGALSGKIPLGGKMGLASRAAVGGAAGVLAEGGTEYIQTGIEQYGKGQDIFTDEAARERFNAAGLGAIGGGAVGAGIGAISRARNVDEAIAAFDATQTQGSLNATSNLSQEADALQATIRDLDQSSMDLGARREEMFGQAAVSAQDTEPLKLGHQAGEPLVVFKDGSTMTRAEYEAEVARRDQARLDGMVQDAPLPGMMARATERAADLAKGQQAPTQTTVETIPFEQTPINSKLELVDPNAPTQAADSIPFSTPEIKTDGMTLQNMQTPQTEAARQAALTQQQQLADEEQKLTLPRTITPEQGSQLTEVAEDALPEQVRPTAAFLKVMSRILGKQIKWVTGAKFDGMTKDSNTIYLSADGMAWQVIDKTAVFGHEFWHTVKKSHKDIWNTVKNVVDPMFDDATSLKMFRDYFAKDATMSAMTDEQVKAWMQEERQAGESNRDFMLEEFISDLGGNRFGENDFWKDVFSQLEQREGHLKAVTMIRRFVKALTEAIDKLLTVLKMQGFKADNDITAEQLTAVKAALTKGMADYLEATRYGTKEQASVAGEEKMSGPVAANQTLPTRWPTAAGLTPSVNDNMITDIGTLRQNQTQYAKAVNAILEESGMHSDGMAEGTTDEKAEHVVERMKSNLLWLYDQVPEAIRQRSKLWYDGARKIAEYWAKQYSITESQAAGVLAVLSPQKDWFMNVTMAERILDMLSTKMDHRFDSRMDASAFGFLTKESIKDDPESQKNLRAYEAINGKTLGQVVQHGDLRQMGIWLRAYDEAYHDAKHAIVTPEGGFVEDKTTLKGDPTLRAWGDFTALGKVASIYMNGSADNINLRLGKEHKVRNFYNNIYAPKDPRFTTIDTHAVAADMLRPLAGADKPVAENFGKTGSTNVTGLSGTYALHYEAYRRAAEERGVLPREMQSITWEAVRGLFTEGFKGKKENLTAIDDIWRQVDSGELTVEQARDAIVEKAGGIDHPDWWNEGNAEYKEVLRDKTYVQQRDGFKGAKVTFEVAPDPRNKDLKARWDALSQAQKNTISHRVSWKIAAKALASYGDENMKGELHQQLGGWLADTNPSMSIWFNKRASGNKVAEFTRILGYALNQMGMMRTSPRPFDTGRLDEDGKKIKASKMGAIQVRLNKGMTDADIHALYTELRTITGKRNKPYINGHTTADGVMIILHDEKESGISTEDLAQRVSDRLFGRHDVQYDHIYADFPAKGKNNYGLAVSKGKARQDIGLGAEPSVRARADQLRAESNVLIDQLIGDAEQGKFSLPRSDAGGAQRAGAGAAQASAEVPGYGTAAPGAIAVQGFHYSTAERSQLDGRYYGTGTKGEEYQRVMSSRDPRIKERIYFYVDAGRGITPEQGVGSVGHTVNLNNIYDATNDTWVQAKMGRDFDSEDAWMNAFESAVIDNGFDGYVSDFGTQRAAVLLGRHSVKVQPTQATRGAVAESKPDQENAGADAVAKSRVLPGGKMSGADWKRMVPAVVPGADVSMLEDGKDYYKDDVVAAMRGVKYSLARGVESSNGLPNQADGNRTLDGAELKALRRAAANLERPRDGVFLRVTEDGKAIATGPKGTRVPDRFIRFADENGLAFEARRDGRGRQTAGGYPMGGDITSKTEPMPAEYRESGAMYFGEGNVFYDRTGMSRFSLSRTPSASAQKEIAAIEARLAKSPSDFVAKNLENIKRGLAGEVVRDENGNLLAPNGRKSKLTEQQYLQVRTPEFINWFGDWLLFHNAKNGNGVWEDGAKSVSKVVDENGEPMVAYHGSENGGFRYMRPEKGDKHRSPMIFAAKTRDTARSYSGRGDEIDLNTGLYEDAEGYDRDENDYDQQRGVYSLFLNIRNPNESDFEKANWDGQRIDSFRVLDENGDPQTGDDGTTYMSQNDAEALAESLGDGFEVVEEPYHYETTNTVAEDALRYGNDGAIIRSVIDDGGRGGHVDPDDVFVIFDSNQAKSATQNVGTFSTTNDDLRYSTRRAINGEFDANAFIAPDIEPWLSNKQLVDLAFVDGKPIRLNVGYDNGPGSGKGAVHLVANAERGDGRRNLDQVTDDDGENVVRTVLNALAKQGASLHKDKNGSYALRVILANKSLILADQGDHYNIITMLPSAKNKWGDAEWVGRLTFPTTTDATSAEPLSMTSAESSLADQGGQGTYVSTKFDLKAPYGLNQPTSGMVVRQAAAVNQKKRRTPDAEAMKADGLKLSPSRRLIGDSGRQYDAAQRQMFKNVGRDIEYKNIFERTKDYLTKDFAKKMATGIVDQFRGLRDLGDGGQAYMLARLSKGTAGAFDALLHHGKLSIKDGAYDADLSGGFIDRLGTPLNGELDDVLWWIASNRAEKLSKQDRENLFTDQDIAAGKSLASGTTDWDYTIQTGPAKGKVTRDRTLIYADANRVFNEFQKNTLDMAEQSGLIDGASRQFWESEFYVPFYRVSEEDGEFIGTKMGNQLVRQSAFKKLKGGTDKLNSDLLSNTLLNMSHLIDAAAKNRAAKAALEAAENVGAAHKAQPGDKKTVWFAENGQKVEYKVTDPFVMTAITSLEYAGMRNPIMDALSKFKHWLTIGVTASPAFKVRNLIRDSVQAIGTSDLGYNPITNVVAGFKQTKRDSQEYVSALASGALIRFGTMLEGNESARTRQLIKQGVKNQHILDSEPKWRQFYDKFLEPGIAAYNELGNRSEEINRAALYNQLIKKGVSHAEAALMARDLLDFSMQGSFTTIRFLTQVVPFLNARLEGLYKLGRASKEDPRRMAIVTGAVALAGMSLMLAYRDDDDWKKREDWDLNNFFWFKFGGVAWRIPRPFEIGAVASIAERGLQYMIDDEMTGERFRSVMGHLLKDNLAMNPVPQMVKPIIDLYANRDSFSGRPIETMSMEKIDPTERYTSSTSMVARGASKAVLGAASPVQIDHLVRGYFGWLGAFVVGGADMAVRAMADEPTKPTMDYFKFATQGIAQEVPSNSSRYVTNIYEQAKELEQAYGTWRRMIKEGKLEDAKEYAEDNKEKLQRYRSVEAVKKAEAKLSERIRMIERSDLDPDVKKERIANISKMKDAAARRLTPGYSD